MDIVSAFLLGLAGGLLAGDLWEWSLENEP